MQEDASLQHIDAWLRNTTKDHRYALRKWLRWCADNHVSPVRPSVLEVNKCWSAWGKQYEANTCEAYLRRVRDAYRYLAAFGFVNNFEFIAVSRRSGDLRSRQVAIPEQLQARPEVVLALRIMAETGWNVRQVAEIPRECLHAVGTRYVISGRVLRGKVEEIPVTNTLVSLIVGMQQQHRKPSLVGLSATALYAATSRATGGVRSLRRKAAAV
jgi:hypothetical protein